MKFAIIDYGAGNSASVQNAFTKIGANAVISANASEWQSADALIFPGVGAFGAAVSRLGSNLPAIKEIITRGVPFLGICLGMQFLMQESEESPGALGLGMIPGRVSRFNVSLPVPQMGWNKVSGVSSLFDGVPYFYAYFVHSYYCQPTDASWVAATTDYEICFPSAFQNKNIFATQFHLEKSGKAGLQILQNFIREVKR